MAKNSRGSIRGSQLYGDEYADALGAELERRIKALEAGNVTTPTGSTVLTGIPEPVSVLNTRVDDDEMVWYLIRWNIPGTTYELRCETLKVKKDGVTYAHDPNDPSKLTYQHHHTDAIRDSDRQNGTLEWELGPFPPLRKQHLIKAVAKLLSVKSDGGGTRAQNPTTDDNLPTNANQAATYVPLLVLPAYGAQAGSEVENEIMNSKFKWSQATYRNGSGIHDAAGDSTACAKWRKGTPDYKGFDESRYIVFNNTQPNWWDKNTSQLVLTSDADPSLDAVARLHGRQWDGSEPFHVSFLALMGGQWSVADQILDFTVQLEDSSFGVIASTTMTDLGTKLSRSEWRHIRLDETSVLASFSNAVGAQQGLRFRIRGTLSAGKQLRLYKVQASHMAGAYKPHPNDRSQDDAPDAGPPSSSFGGLSGGYGRSGGEVPPGSGGIIIRPSTE